MGRLLADPEALPTMIPEKHGVTISVILNIVNPFETFTPRSAGAELLEISMDSVRVRSYLVKQEDCEVLVRTRHVSKIFLEAPFLSHPLILKADVFWARYVETDPDSPPYADLGFNFRTLEPGEQEMLEQIVAAVHGEGGRA